MKLAAIICVWSDAVEFLPSCISNVAKVAEEVIVVWSLNSNHGVRDNAVLQFITTTKLKGVTWVEHEPTPRLRPAINEIRKRNRGIDEAYKLGCTHFLMMDADEYFKPEELRIDKERFKNPDLNGMVHRIKVFVGAPTLCCMDNNTLVPGIQKLEKHTEVGTFRKYPFAYDKAGTAKIDGTRRTNVNSGVIMSDYFMYHFSYLRRNIDLKIANSSANLGNRSAVIKRDIANAKPGHVSELYGNALEEVENFFDIQI